MQGIGYKEVYDGLINGNLSDVSELIKLNTRHYAKRQITFFKRLEGLKSLTPNISEGIETIMKDLKNAK